LPDVVLRVNASIGVAVAAARVGAGVADSTLADVAARSTDDIGDELLRRADIALYDAKAAGKGRYAVFSG
jgi:GGDEF domain-containing protein